MDVPPLVLKPYSCIRYEGQWLNDKKEGSGRYYYRSRRKVSMSR